MCPRSREHRLEKSSKRSLHSLRRAHQGVLGADLVLVQLLVRPLLRPHLRWNSPSEAEHSNAQALRGGGESICAGGSGSRSQFSAQLLLQREEVLPLLPRGGGKSGAEEPLRRGLRGALLECPGGLDQAHPSTKYSSLLSHAPWH